MFLLNKYTKWYNSIINNARSRNLDGYKEIHHIIPKSLGGSNNKNNLVKLTAREHFVCHLLLIKMVNGQGKHKMRYAANRMLSLSNNHIRHIPTSRQYQYIKDQFSIAHSTLMTTLIRTPESNKKRSATLTGRTTYIRTAETNRKASETKQANPQVPWNKGKTTSQKGLTYEEIYGVERAKELKALRSSSLIGKPKSDNAKAIWSKNRSGIVSAYDLINHKTVKVSKAEFDLHRNVRYIGLRSPLIPKE